MAEEKETVAMSLRFGDVEVSPDKRNQNRIKEIVDELVQQLGAFLQIRLG